ncbi:protein BIG GRAIN 1-like A [Andrographis paniculata]|uniref:protein BIG GRAIN 1-like A n=1 Tax=Andrographis paniculata TaxID=175694 RepID=UPI0021E99D8E|nr:protein BIG GRAIN 1-like A [Andrographis paniculata]
MVDVTSRYPRASHSGNSASFSSTLLDAIYRSIDHGEEELVIYRESMRKEKSYCSNSVALKCEEEMMDFRRARMFEKWMEEKVSEKVVVRRKSVPESPARMSRKDQDDFSWSSSDSSGVGGFFSSSEAESFQMRRPKPVRTGGPKKVGENFEFHRCDRGGFGAGSEVEQEPRREGGILKAKSRAMKLYSDLKKVKQPISPGGKLAGLLNSLFAGGNSKKPKISDSYSPSMKSSTCSSASSFSRSCLSKTPSSRGKSSTGAKRSVRFSPVSVFVDDDYRPNKTQSSSFELNDNMIRSVLKENFTAQAMDKNRRVEEIVRDLVQNYHRKNQAECHRDFPIDHLVNSDVKNHNSEDEDDAASYASSDLFELDNLSGVGMEELPVYETTHVGTNQAIANGFIS